MKKFFKYFFGILLALFLILFSFPYFYPVKGEVLNVSSKPYEQSRYAKINDIYIHYREWKSNVDSVRGNVLLIHGFSGSTFSWRNNVDTLVHSGYNVVAVDVPPFGYSSREEISHSISFNSMLIWKLLDSLNDEKWIVVGHSMGAAVAGGMAAMRPKRTQKVVFVDGVFYGTKLDQQPSLFGRMLSSGPVKRLVEFISWRWVYNYSKFNDLLYSAYSKQPDSLAVQGYLEPFKIKGSASAILDLTKSIEVQNLEVDSIKSPVLVIWGDKDSWIPIEAGMKFHEKYPKTEMKVIKGAGHCSMESNAIEFNSMLVNFISAK